MIPGLELCPHLNNHHAGTNGDRRLGHFCSTNFLRDISFTPFSVRVVIRTEEGGKYVLGILWDAPLRLRNVPTDKTTRPTSTLAVSKLGEVKGFERWVEIRSIGESTLLLATAWDIIYTISQMVRNSDFGSKSRELCDTVSESLRLEHPRISPNIIGHTYDSIWLP